MTASIVLADVGSMSTQLINSLYPTVLSIVAILGVGLHALLNRTTNPRLQQAEKDILVALNKVDNLTQTVESHTDTVSALANIVASLSPAIANAANSKEVQDRVTAIENNSESLEQKLQDLQALISKLQSTDDSGDSNGDTQDSKKVSNAPVVTKDKAPIHQG
jgi:chromosome segregation ATPase